MLAAEETNNYFCMVGTNLAKDIAPTGKKFTTKSVKCKFKWEFPLTEHQVGKEICKLSDSKSSGPC